MLSFSIVFRVAALLSASLWLAASPALANNVSSDWLTFMRASASRFEAQYERQILSPGLSVECDAQTSELAFASCINRDAFIRSAILASGVSVEEYARHWQLLHASQKRLKRQWHDYLQLRDQWLPAQANTAASAAP